MNNNELVRELEKQMARYGYRDTRTHIEIFIKEYEALTKDKKPIRLKDVIKHIQGFDDETKLKWTYDILKELGSDFGSKMFHEGYQQGNFEGAWVGNQLKDADKVRRELNKPVVKQFIADWYEENKDVFEANLYRFVCNLTSIFDGAKINEFERWFLTAGTKPFQTLVNMHQFGYEVEKEKRYLVKMKGILKGTEVLNYKTNEEKWVISSRIESTFYRAKHTRKELEEAGFGWVFDCEGIEVEEVAE